MTNEERDIISQFIARVGGATPPSGFAGGSVPPTQPTLPPVDRDADSFIGQQLAQYPEARYRITQLAFVQEHALVEAQNRIQRLEWELQQAQQAAQQAQQGGQKPGGGFFSGLFGGGNRQQAPQGDPRWGGQGGPQQAQGYPGRPGQQGYYPQAAPPQPQYPPNYQQSMFQQRGGSGFLGSALTTAAGVAGGMVAGNALMSLFSPHQGLGGGFAGGGLGEGAASPWATPAAPSQDYVDTGNWDQSGSSDTSWTDNSGSNDTSWTDNSGGGSDGGGWDSGGGSSDDTF